MSNGEKAAMQTAADNKQPGTRTLAIAVAAVLASWQVPAAAQERYQ